MKVRDFGPGPKWVRIFVYIYIYVMYVCMDGWMYVCMYVTYVCMYVM